MSASRSRRSWPSSARPAIRPPPSGPRSSSACSSSSTAGPGTRHGARRPRGRPATDRRAGSPDDPLRQPASCSTASIRSPSRTGRRRPGQGSGPNWAPRWRFSVSTTGRRRLRDRRLGGCGSAPSTWPRPAVEEAVPEPPQRSSAWRSSRSGPAAPVDPARCPSRSARPRIPRRRSGVAGSRRPTVTAGDEPSRPGGLGRFVRPAGQPERHCPRACARFLRGAAAGPGRALRDVQRGGSPRSTRTSSTSRAGR